MDEAVDRHRQTDRWAGRQAGRQADRQTDRQIGSQTQHTEGQTETTDERCLRAACAIRPMRSSTLRRDQQSVRIVVTLADTQTQIHIETRARTDTHTHIHTHLTHACRLEDDWEVFAETVEDLEADQDMQNNKTIEVSCFCLVVLHRCCHRC